MQLKIKQDQYEKGLLLKKTIYTLDVRVEYSDEERAEINARKLGGSVLWEGDKITITVRSLKDGHHIESPDLGVIAGAAEQIQQRCKDLKNHIQVSQEFKGQEGVIEI